MIPFLGVFTFKNEVNNDAYNFQKWIPLRITHEFIKENFGNAGGPEIVIDSGRKNGIKEPDFLLRVEQLKSWLNQNPHVSKTVDIVDILKDMNPKHERGEGGLLRSSHGTKNHSRIVVSLYSLSLPEGMNLNSRMSLDQQHMRMSVFWDVEKSQQWGQQSERIVQKGRELGLDVKVTGKYDLFHRLFIFLITTFITSLFVALVVITFLMFLAFGSLKIGLLATLANFLPLFVGGGFMYVMSMDLNMSTILVASICLGIAVDDTIHFLLNYVREYRERGGDTYNAVMHTLYHTGGALINTTVILILAFSLFCISGLKHNWDFGLICGVVLFAALIGDILLLPAIFFKLEDFFPAGRKKTSH